METEVIITQFEAALSQQVALAGDDPAAQTAGDAILAALYPAARQLALNVAEQAAIEVGAQLPEHEVEVVLNEGEPSLRVRAAEASSYATGGFESRLTLRLPATLKEAVEDAAVNAGDSVNSYVVKALSSRAGGRNRWARRRVQGTVQT